MMSESRLATLLPIRNMDRAIRFYTESLGGEVTMRGEEAMKDNWASLKLAGSEVWLIKPEKREPRSLAYTTLLVDDIQVAVDELKEKGVKFQRATKASKEDRVDGPIAYNPYGANAFFKDPEGNLLMLYQAPSSGGSSGSE